MCCKGRFNHEASLNPRRVLLRDCAAQAWRNGGGVTHELLAWPRGQDWLLRVSVATIDRSGPFSPFPGVQRWFTVLDGAGVMLDLAAGATPLTVGSEPVHFEGEQAPVCKLLHGPTRDLNLMSRRDAGLACMRRLVPGSVINGATHWRGVYAAGALTLEINGDACPLEAGTLLWSDDPAPATWAALACPGTAWWLTLTP